MTDFYHSKQWLRLRRAILQRDGWQCQLAKMRGKNEPAVTVHHIFPISEFPEYKLKEWNLISLSLSAHNMMHVRDTDKLTRRGELLRQQVAEEQGIKIDKKTILVIGNPSAGKTTYVKQNMKRGVVYDLDAIAGALRLKAPKAEDYKPARWIANSLLKGFPEAAHKYTDEVWIIRTAPSIQELQEIDPTKLVAIYGNYGDQRFNDDRRSVMARKIKAAVDYASNNNIEVVEVDHQS